MSDPRYSIIPAGAVTDPRLEGRDLQVLCFLGTCSDKLGWCFLSQATIAEKLGCGRSTVQRSLTRLYQSAWVEMRSSAGDSSRPYACHAYRVVMDRDDPQVSPSELEVEDQKRDEGCPPVGTSTHGRADLPTGGQGGAHVCMGTEQPSKILEGGADASARAREAQSLVKPEAWKLATEIAAVAGYPDPQSWPPGWCGAPMRVQAMLDHGWQAEIMLASTRAVMARKTGDPPSSINYFEKPFASAHVQQSKPFPTGSQFNEKPARRSGITAAIDRHIERFEREESEQDGGGEVRETPARLLSDGRSQR